MTKEQQDWIDKHGVKKCPPSPSFQFNWRGHSLAMQPASELRADDPEPKLHPWRGQWDNTAHRRKP